MSGFPPMLYEYNQSCRLPVSSQRSVMVHLWVVNIKLFLSCTSMEDFVPGKSASLLRQVQRSWSCVSTGNDFWLPWQTVWGRERRTGMNKNRGVNGKASGFLLILPSFLLECCTGRSISISGFSYDSLSCLTSVNCHVKGLILASLRQPNIPPCSLLPRGVQFLHLASGGKASFSCLLRMNIYHKKSYKHQSDRDCVYPASSSKCAYY